MIEQDPKQMKWVESLPASQEAERLLKLVKAPATRGIPDLISLLQWAVEDAADEYSLDATKAQPVLDELLYLVGMKKPRAAVKILLNLDNPEEELPPELLKTEPKDLAIGLISLAQQAKAA